jgi:hypothetical protein
MSHTARARALATTIAANATLSDYVMIQAISRIDDMAGGMGSSPKACAPH